MTRPQIIRADTIDLQDQTSPSAQDHTRQPSQPSPLGIGPAAPHQAAAVKHVVEERSAEEEILAQAWSEAQALVDDITSDDERTLVGDVGEENHRQRDEQAIRQNGGSPETVVDSEGVEGEGDDNSEDDLMDKISSSPSIDDGGYILPSAWPKRASSVTALSTPTRQTTPSPSVASVDLSSPFTLTPAHFPLSIKQIRPNSPFSTDSSSSSSYLSTPASLSIHVNATANMSSEHHHRVGEYAPAADFADTDETRINDVYYGEKVCAKRDTLASVVNDSGSARLDKEMGLNADIDDADIQALLLPEDDPLLDNSFDDIPLTVSRSYSPTSSASSWETASDADTYSDEDNLYDDDADDVFFPDDSRFVDSGWGGECLRELEDIDFEFVYALHTFVATVEGQANASKGDTMVLLDDSNSYWWLVRVVKDSSIGYLPAEHIETPTERLARLNKHRNIDLSATMLGDTMEKSKNPLKKAMRRRNAKTVQFTAPTYVEASDYDYSSDEENAEGDGLNGGEHLSVEGQDGQVADRDETMNAAPLKAKGARNEVRSELGNDGTQDRRRGVDDSRASDETLDRQFTPSGKSRNGTLRNTDSFFKDDNVETRKITLTPNLLRDDSGVSSRERSSSFESIDKNLSAVDRAREERKKKDRKPGMLSGLFKKKEKKGKTQEGGTSNPEKRTSSPEKPPDRQENASPQSNRSEGSEGAGLQSPQRTSSKGRLQKIRPGEASPPELRSPVSINPASASSSLVQAAAETSPSTTGSTIRSVQAEPDQAVEKPAALRIRTPDQQPIETNRTTAVNSGGKLSNLTSILRSSPDQPKREKVKRAKQRIELDDFDSSPDTDKATNPFTDPDADDDNDEYRDPELHGEHTEPQPLSESPVQISPVEYAHDTNAAQLPALVADTSSQEGGPDFSPISPTSPTYGHMTIDPSPVAAAMASAIHVSAPSAARTKSPSPSSPEAPTAAHAAPSLTLSPAAATQPQQQQRSSPQPAPPRSSPSPAHSLTSPLTPTPSWSDANLRAYLDDGTDIRDMLILVNDTSCVVPVGVDHPIVAGLFGEERASLERLGRELDGLLGGWIERKRARGVGVGVGA